MILPAGVEKDRIYEPGTHSEVALVTAPFADVDVAIDAGAVCSYDHAGQLFADGFANGDLSSWSFATGS